MRPSFAPTQTRLPGRWVGAVSAALLAVSWLASCGGGGGGTSPAAATAPVPPPSAAVDPDVFSPEASPQLVTGAGHLTVRWSPMPGALDYEVWFQQDGAATRTLSRAAIPLAADRVHTATSLLSTAGYRVWVKARLADGTRRVSAPVSGMPIFTPPTTPDENAAFVPAVVDVPVLDIQTVGAAPVVSRDDYLTATYSLYANSASRTAAAPLVAGALDIRGRGHSTWTEFAKKPYKLRLGTSTALLGMPANRHWVLLANQADKSLVRNETVFELSRRFGMAWTPRSRFVEVFLNGGYIGHYQLVEHVRTGTSRVNIASLGAGDNAEPQVSGGYFLALERPGADTTFVSTACRRAFELQTPEAPTGAQSTYIERYINDTEAALLGAGFADPATGYAAWLNVDTFVDWYIVNELALNSDAFRASTFFYKDRGARLSIGPVWDMDVALGNNDRIYPDNPANATAFGPLGESCWYARLLQDPAFVRKVKARWQALRARQLASLPDFVDAQAATLAQSQANNFSRWLILDKRGWSNVVVPRGYAGEVEYLHWWLQRRIAWLDAQWGA